MQFTTHVSVICWLLDYREFFARTIPFTYYFYLLQWPVIADTSKTSFFFIFRMTCRGEFSFIIAAFALSEGLIDPKMYAAVVWAVLLSATTGPFMLLNAIKYFKGQQKKYLEETNVRYIQLHIIRFVCVS